MTITWRKRRNAAAAPEASGDGHGFSGASAVATRSATVLLWGVLAAGPIALGLALVDSDDPAPVQPVAADNGDDPDRQVAEEFAEQAVVTWLTATRSQPDQSRLADLFGPDLSVELPDEPVPARRPAVAASEPAGDGIWSVVVAVDVPAAAPVDEDPAVARRYFQLPVVVDGDAVGALAAPAPVPAPEHLAPRPSTYTTSVPRESEVTRTVGEFLSSLLTGAGGLDRVVAPGVQIHPIHPAPYTEASVSAVAAVDEPPQAPADGDELDVLATARVRHDHGEAIVQYPLRLIARDGRWEIAAIAPAPVHTKPSPAPVATP